MVRRRKSCDFLWRKEVQKSSLPMGWPTSRRPDVHSALGERRARAWRSGVAWWSGREGKGDEPVVDVRISDFSRLTRMPCGLPSVIKRVK